MKRIIFIVAAALLLLVLIFLYLQKHKEDGYLTLYGNVDVRQVDLGFRISGRVAKMPFEEGDLVEEGALMGTLDTDPYLAQVSQAQAVVNSTSSSLENAEILLKRRTELITDGSVSKEDYDNAYSNVSVLRANLNNALAALAVSKSNLSYTEIFAPTKGIVLTRIREPGTVVNPGDPIYTLSIISPVWVRAYVAEPDLGNIYFGMPAEIHTDTKNGKVYHGTIGFISPVAEFTPKTVQTTQLRTDLVYRLRIYAENPDEFLKQGMPVTVKLQKKQ